MTFRIRPLALTCAALLGLAGTAPLSGQTEGPGGFRITLLGTGAPRPSFQRYGPSTLIEAGTSRILLDPSWGLRERLMQAGSFELMVGLQHVLLTHLHYDHTVGLPDLWLTGWLYGRRAPLELVGEQHPHDGLAGLPRRRERVDAEAVGVDGLQGEKEERHGSILLAGEVGRDYSARITNPATRPTSSGSLGAGNEARNL